MKQEKVQEIKDLLGKLTEGKWFIERTVEGHTDIISDTHYAICQTGNQNYDETNENDTEFLSRSKEIVSQLVDALEKEQSKVKLLEESLRVYKEDLEKHEKSTHIDTFEYELNINERKEIPILIKTHGVEHTMGVTERDAKSFVHLFKMHNWEMRK